MRSIIPEARNPALREPSHKIAAGDIKSLRIKKLISDMKELLMKEEYGVALAAVQVGEPVRLFIVSGRAIARDARNAPDSAEATPGKPDEPGKRKELPALPDQVFINPVMVKMSRGKKEKHEGCLSIRGKWGEVPRAEKATVQALDEEGRAFSRGASGFLAHVFQHEMDHLEGILYTDKATKLYDEEPEQKV